MDAEPLISFVNERHAVYMRKEILKDQRERGLAEVDLSETGKAAWGDGGWSLDHLTNDTILAEYKFTNCFRQLDRTTQWITENISVPYAEHEHLWFMLSIARFVNWPPALEELMIGGFDIVPRSRSWPSHPEFSPAAMTRIAEHRRSRGEKGETGAFMIRAESRRDKEWYSWSKQRYVAEVVLGRPWKDRQFVSEFFDLEPTLEEAWVFLTGAVVEADWVGWGPFMSGQVVADLRHTRYLSGASDVGRWAAVGPGSSRGLNRLAGRPVTKLVRQDQGLEEMLQLQYIVNAQSASWVPAIELHDIQNCLCEVDKYIRVQRGEGRPRAKYRPETAY